MPSSVSTLERSRLRQKVVGASCHTLASAATDFDRRPPPFSEGTCHFRGRRRPFRLRAYLPSSVAAFARRWSGFGPHSGECGYRTASTALLRGFLPLRRRAEAFSSSSVSPPKVAAFARRWSGRSGHTLASAATERCPLPLSEGFCYCVDGRRYCCLQAVSPRTEPLSPEGGRGFGPHSGECGYTRGEN